MMIRRATSGRIDTYSNQDDGAIYCKACGHIIISKENLKDDNTCPYCHNNVNTDLSQDDFEDEGEIIARPC